MLIASIFLNPFDWTIYKKYFKGEKLEEELAFSNYYHYENPNRLLHFISSVCIFSLLTA